MKLLKTFFLLIIIGALVGSAALAGIYFYFKPDLPSVAVLKDVRLQTPMRIYTKDGSLISQYGVKRRIPVKLEDVPQQMIDAVLATEDSRFYEHYGIDPIGMTRAVINLIVTGEKQQGASTLTMQLARGFFLTREKTYIRKIKEIFIAWHMEQLLSKEEILELYLNKVELGHRSFGVGAAAQVYYGKTLDELTLAQTATLAGLPKAPSALNPVSGPKRSVERRRVVLLRMLDEGYITRAQFDEAAAAPVTARKHGAEIETQAPYLADLIHAEMVKIYGKEEAETGGYQVYATAPTDLQLAARQAVVSNLHDYDERHGYRGPLRYLWGPEAQAADASDTETPQPETAQPDSASASNGLDQHRQWSEADMLAVLQKVEQIAPLVPAVVTTVAEQSVEVLSINGNRHTLSWENLDWARPYITDSRQGDEPEQASDILSPGAVIYIRQHNQQWRLAQMPQASGALIALNPANGAVQAVVGGYSFYQSQFNRATQAKRQVGSNIKPFIYSAALNSGYTVASIMNDAPINQWNEATGVAWRPKNSPPQYDGPIRMRVALGKSKNVVSVRLLRGVGLYKTAEYLERFGFDKEDIPRDETLALGSGSHTPLEVARGIATIANGGYLIQPHFIDRVLDEQGTMLWQADPMWACDPCDTGQQRPQVTDMDKEERLAQVLDVEVATGDSPLPKRSAPQVITPQNAFLVADMMRTGVQANGSWSKKTYWMGTGWRAKNLLQRDDLAGKTGTTNDSRDAWFSGFQKDLVVTAWVGFDDMNRNLGRATRNQNLINRNPERFNWIGNAMIGSESGAHAAQPAWIRFMEQALEGVPEKFVPVPEDMVRVRIDRTSGKLTRRTDHTTLFEYFVTGTEPTVYVLDDQIKDPAREETKNAPEPEEIF
ncbi:penicillin-binding protein 1A [Salinimonas marina]|uniref:Penicillin-binding protein 1A n=1 Tax=Salinimonas marina TaxID=2785918 RepID=A0A7S9DX29_9ALTE|nr:penicillin-binding protein 1A [Salinimonas marina]QPG05417.1 penicillin-binding protein 1A [Salinimonas marina]